MKETNKILEIVLKNLSGTYADKYMNQIDELFESIIMDEDITDDEETLLFAYIACNLNAFISEK